MRQRWKSDDVVGAFDEDGLGAVISASRSLTYLSKETTYASESRVAALAMRDAINEALGI